MTTDPQTPIAHDLRCLGALANRALISASEFIALTGDSRSYFYKQLREGKIPPPAVRSGPRYTRWKSIDVAEYLRDPQAWLAARSAVSTLAEAA